MSRTHRRMRFITIRDIEDLPQLSRLSAEDRFAMRVVAHVFPFRANNYVVEELIDWSRVPDDPIFRLTFPQRDMLKPAEFGALASAVRQDARTEIARIVASIRGRLNPHPAGQADDNVPLLHGEPVAGIQHKYRETALVFPSAGQTCHAYCTYCFRWPQFVRTDALKFATDKSRTYLSYLARHPEITDVLLTGGDPLIMKADRLRAHVEPLLQPEYDHIQTIRIGTKSPAYWPHRFVDDADSEELLRLFERIVDSGKHLALMAHFSHWRELATGTAREAIRKIRGTGAVVRTQAPLIRHVNDDARAWTRMWTEQVQLGCVPYYMFVERDTGAHHYFSVPLARALDIYQAAFRRMSGIGRTARGPVMSAHPGKVHVQGVTHVAGQKAFVLALLQARDPEQAGRTFFARYDPRATWLTELRPLAPGPGHVQAGHILSTDRHSGQRRQLGPRVSVSSTERQTP
ncbi:MAG: lysine 2,3-aminomutase [marine benthic group bacterium]|nr:lysine 2,3-aminomutase [Gemmatimonadota bacterium]